MIGSVNFSVERKKQMSLLRVIALLAIIFVIGCTHALTSTEETSDTEIPQSTQKQAESTIKPEPMNLIDLIKSGDRVRLDYTCYADKGQAIATNISEVCEDSKTKKSRVFTCFDKEADKIMTAGASIEFMDEKSLIPFEVAIRNELSDALVGLLNGKRMRVFLDADQPPNIKDDERRIGLAIKRKRPKKLVLDIQKFNTKFEIEPELGQAVDMYRELEGTIVDMNDKEIEIKFTPKSNEELKNEPFGEAIIHEKRDFFVVEVAADIDSLVKTGPYIGKIEKKEKGMFFLDYADPFGGRTFLCELVANRIDENSIDRNDPSVVEKTVPVPQDGESEKPAGAVNGDLTAVVYTARLSDGNVFFTNDPDVAGDSAILKSELYYAADPMVPDSIVVGQPARVPGVENAIAGMTVGQEKTVTLEPTEAFGLPSPRLIKTFPMRSEMPVNIVVEPDKFVQENGFLPKEGQIFTFNPYVNARVESIDDEGAHMVLSPRTEKVKESYGLTTVAQEGERIVVKLEPEIGALYTLQGKTGKIVSKDGTNFTIDFNSPLAGKTITIDMKLLSLEKADSFKRLEWHENYDEGLALAEEQKKPMVLLLYASWCKWCKRMMNESLEDPRIKVIGEEFVWVKVDSDKERGIKEIFEQNGYPLIVLLNSNGDEIARLDGFRDAIHLRQSLDVMLHGNYQAKTGESS